MDVARARQNENLNPICPRLRRLKWEDEKPSTLKWITSFLHPGLTDVMVAFNQFRDEDLWYNVAKYLPKLARCSNLRSLHLAGYLDGDPVPPVFFSDLRSLSKLESFTCECGDVELDGLVELSYLSALQSIAIDLCSDGPPGRMLRPLPKMFNLKKASVTVDFFHLAIVFLNVIHPSPIKQLCIEIKNNDDCGESSIFREFSMGLQSHTHWPLTCLEIEALDSSWDEDLPRLDPHALEPFLDCGNLEIVKIRLHLAMLMVDDKMLLRMTTAWPNLKHFALGLLENSRQFSKVTVKGLRAFQKCPNLESVELAFNATAGAILDHNALPPAQAACNSKLKTLDVLNTIVLKPRPLAAALLDIFPNLEKIDAWGNFDDEDESEELIHTLWAVCNDIYQCLKALRKQTRCKQSKLETDDPHCTVPIKY
ncbi:hypothetical protein HWV62_4393 [Athelia sp. TMB]|nr:hypothetical protein HWV62_4393 [Athelia sp. TMB]